MAEFTYRAIAPDGKVVTGSQTAETEFEVEKHLAGINLELISIRQQRSSFHYFKKTTIDRREMINFCFYLEQLTQAGIPIVDALTDLKDSMDDCYLRDVVSGLNAKIGEGQTFSEALGAFPRIFGRSFVSLINAGEKSGELSYVLKDLSDSLKWQDELIAQTKKALTLPAFVAFVVFGVVFFLMVYLVPQMMSFVNSMGHELPLHTQALVFVSDIFVNYWYLILMTPIFVILVFSQLLKHNSGVRMWFDTFKLKVWLVGPVLKKIILARFSNYLALLCNSGIPLLKSLEITETISENKAIEQALVDVGQQIADGASLSYAFETVNLFPKLVIRMVNVGENTGDISHALKNVSYFYKRDVDDAIDRIQSLIEPIMTLVLGAIIGWVMLSVLGPVYDLISQIKI